MSVQPCGKGARSQAHEDKLQATRLCVKILCSTLILLLSASASWAQCPGGWCPIPQTRRQVVRPQRPAVSQTRITRYVPGRQYYHSRAVSQRVRYNGTSDWTWPGDLRDHMREHGVSAQGASRQQLQRQHDVIHTRKSAEHGRQIGYPNVTDAVRYLQ